MGPEEKMLLERTFRLSEENNHILRKMRRAARWAILWGFIKTAVIVVPLVVGYFYLEPFFKQAMTNYNDVREFIDTMSR